MAGHQSRKWMILMAAIWVQAFTGTNFDFSSYSSTLKSVLSISQVQLNYLAMASDMGKAFGWCCGLSLMHFPLWFVLFMAAFMGLFGYGLQWLVIAKIVSFPYALVFLLCLTAGCSICWFNTVCYVLCIKNFPTTMPLALSLTVSFNGLTAAFYTLIANAINPDDSTLYLLLNASAPLFVSILALFPVLRQPALPQLSTDTPHHEYFVFLILNILAIFTGLYLLLSNSMALTESVARILLGGAVLLLVFPFSSLGFVSAENWASNTSLASLQLFRSSFNLVDTDESELVRELVGNGNENGNGTSLNGNSYHVIEKEGLSGCFTRIMKTDRLTMLGEEHPAQVLVHKWDFWLYYFAYFCGGTIGLVYANNLGQIAQSLGYINDLKLLIALYSSCSFFGRLLSAAPEFQCSKVYFARTGWLAVSIVPMPFAFFLLVASGSSGALQVCTALVGLSSGFVFAASVSVTSELFGPNSVGVNHNILITNIPIGSLVYGLLAAVIYDANAGSTSLLESLLGEEMVCIGRQCYLKTFIAWGCISLVGLVSSFMLFLRTKPAYYHSERTRNLTQSA